MKRHRFIVSSKLKTGTMEINDPELVDQIRKVLKLRSGEWITLCDGDSNEASAEIVRFGKDSVAVNVAEVAENKTESSCSVVLYCSVLKKENFELVCQKATEVGVSKIVPIVSARTIKLNLRYDRLNKILKEAAEQSGRGIIPELSEIMDLEFSVAEAKKENDRNIFFDPTGENINSISENLKNKKQIGIFVGPEGGWTEQEIKLAKENNLEIINLGKTILRAETAAIVGSFVVQLNNG